jgi:hypothetical protein
VDESEHSRLTGRNGGRCALNVHGRGGCAEGHGGGYCRRGEGRGENVERHNYELTQINYSSSSLSPRSLFPSFGGPFRVVRTDMSDTAIINAINL